MDKRQAIKEIITGLHVAIQSKNGVGFLSCFLQREIAIRTQYCLYKS